MEFESGKNQHNNTDRLNFKKQDVSGKWEIKKDWMEDMKKSHDEAMAEDNWAIEQNAYGMASWAATLAWCGKVFHLGDNKKASIGWVQDGHNRLITKAKKTSGMKETGEKWKNRKRRTVHPPYPAQIPLIWEMVQVAIPKVPWICASQSTIC